MKFLCPGCRAALPDPSAAVVSCPGCGVAVDLTRADTAPGESRLMPEVDLSGEQLGDYRLERRLGAGGMGAVYLAQGSAGPCAVKVLSTLLGADPALRERFRREAAALRALTHPHIVRGLAEGETRGFSWYAMERVEGPDLRARLAQGKLPAPEVEALARALLGALGAVHGAGLVHRDLKPGNVLLGPSGAKLCDFGIARLDGATTLTESAALLGSLRYMAPEQRSGHADARSDLYALGLVLHEALAGGLPQETALPSVPRRLRRLIAALTAEAPRARPPTAAQALALLDARTPVAWLGAAAALGLAALGAGLGLPALSAREAPTRTKEVESAPVRKASPPPPQPASTAPEPQPPAMPVEEAKALTPPEPNLKIETIKGLQEKPAPGPKLVAKPTREVPTKSPSKKKAKPVAPRGKGTELDLGTSPSK